MDKREQFQELLDHPIYKELMSNGERTKEQLAEKLLRERLGRRSSYHPMVGRILVWVQGHVSTSSVSAKAVEELNYVLNGRVTYGQYSEMVLNKIEEQEELGG